jgi:EAL and modified HD-GYP domain-containing signal transduction protein
VKSNYVARQAILDRGLKTVAYELLFRNGPEHVFRCESLPRATSSVIADGFLMIGIDALTGGLPAWVNFSRETLVDDSASLLPPRFLVVEVLETVEPNAEIVRACRALKRAGYTLALDDFAWSEAWHPMLALADVVKVDFLATRGAERALIAKRLRRYGVRLLAEKVETLADFQDALACGYELFQGFFFSRPTLTHTPDLRGLESAHLRILEAVSSPDCDLRALEELVRRDLALTYKLLRRASSAAFGQPAAASSVRHALALLGVEEVRKWVALLVMAGVSRDKPAELVRLALLRARFCEEVAPLFGLERRATDLFLAGLFSEIDAMLGRPMEEILAELAFEPELAGTLRGEETPLVKALRCARAWERGDWARIEAIADTLEARGDGLPEAYAAALAWLREVDELSA